MEAKVVFNEGKKRKLAYVFKLSALNRVVNIAFLKALNCSRREIVVVKVTNKTLSKFETVRRIEH